MTDYPYVVRYFLPGDGWFIRRDEICYWLIDTEIDCRISYGEPHAGGKDIVIFCKNEEDMVAIKLRFDHTVTVVTY